MAVDDREMMTGSEHQLDLLGEYPAQAASVRQAREAVAELARENGASSRCVEDVRLAISEAATNVVLHAYAQNSEGPFRVLASILDGERLDVVVEDDGRGLSAPARTPGLGAGLQVMVQVADTAIFLERETGGSTVRLSFELQR